jgi:NAD(P)-dependent dehydrogenase (short-subunit alcohol dehydrogenase family)
VARQTGAVCIPGDLREPGCPRRTVEAAVGAFGGLDVLVSNAGVGWSGSFASMSEADIDSLLDVNLRAGAHLARAAGQAAVPADEGAVLQRRHVHRRPAAGR